MTRSCIWNKNVSFPSVFYQLVKVIPFLPISTFELNWPENIDYISTKKLLQTIISGTMSSTILRIQWFKYLIYDNCLSGLNINVELLDMQVLVTITRLCRPLDKFSTRLFSMYFSFTDTILAFSLVAVNIWEFRFRGKELIMPSIDFCSCDP